MAYERYSKMLNKEEYFATGDWKKDSLQAMTDLIKNAIYKKYRMRFEVWNRDKFTCQNVVKNDNNGVIHYDPCPWCKNEFKHPVLTMHHVKSKRNGGNDSARNGVTLCRTSHSRYEEGKGSITLRKDANLPDWMKGHTYRLSKRAETVDWRAYRKNLKHEFGIVLSDEEWLLLMSFLDFNFKDLDV